MRIESHMTVRLLIMGLGLQLMSGGRLLAGDPVAVATDQYTPGEVLMHAGLSSDAAVYRLWPGDGKRADDPIKDQQEVFDGRVRNVSCPSVTVMQPKQANSVAVILFPGGGYHHLAAGKEGIEVGRWLNGMGITAFVVKYRVPRREDLVPPLQDAQRALRWVRANARHFGVDAKKTGVMGFSAGGHLAASCIHQFDVASYAPLDAMDQASCKPDFGVLIYPAYLGKADKVAAPFDQVKDPQIPVFIAISRNDSFVKGVNLYVPVLKGAEVNHESHIYAEGAHGTGMHGFPWPKDAEDWLRRVVKWKGSASAGKSGQ